MRTYASSRVKRKSFYRKSELQMFFFPRPYWCTKTVHQYGVSIQSSTKVRETFWANNSETVGHKAPRLGKIIYILVFYNISFSWLLPLDGFQVMFLLRDSENDLYDLHFQLLINCTSGRVHVNLYLDFIRAYLQK